MEFLLKSHVLFVVVVVRVSRRSPPEVIPLSSCLLNLSGDGYRVEVP